MNFQAPHLYNNSGNAIMRGTPEYNSSSSNGKKNNTDSLREELEAYSYEDLVNFFKTSVDPDGTEDISGLNEEDLIELILEKMVQNGGAGKRKLVNNTNSNNSRMTTNNNRTLTLYSGNNVIMRGTNEYNAAYKNYKKNKGTHRRIIRSHAKYKNTRRNNRRNNRRNKTYRR
jgi:hypothetical protein